MFTRAIRELSNIIGWRWMVDPTTSVLTRINLATAEKPDLGRKAILLLDEHKLERVPLISWILTCGAISIGYDVILPITLTSFVLALVCGCCIAATLGIDKTRSGLLESRLALMKIRDIQLGGATADRACMLSAPSEAGFMDSLAGLGMQPSETARKVSPENT